jgi:hypothetical protein
MHVPAKISECEASQCGVWEFSGKGGTARWPSGASATLIVDRFNFDNVTVRRNDRSGSTPGFVAVYTGKVIGNQLLGQVDWYWPGHWSRHVNGKWAATILEPASYNIIDPNIPCRSSYAISPSESLERGAMATEAHKAIIGACWLQMSADAGNATAQGMLAAIYYKGIGVPVNLPEAVRLAKKAAEQDNYVGERCLWLMYSSGKGLPKDPAKADYWRAKADQDKLAAVKADEQEQQQLAEQQQEARRYQAQQAQLQQRAVAELQFRQNAQSLALIGLLLGIFASDFDSEPSSSGSSGIYTNPYNHNQCYSGNGGCGSLPPAEQPIFEPPPPVQ